MGKSEVAKAETESSIKTPSNWHITKCFPIDQIPSHNFACNK